MGKVRVIIKRPDEKYGHVTNISASLKNLQNTVEGNIEVVRLPVNNGDVMLVNEEGKLKGLEHNFYMDMGLPPFMENIVGTVIVIGTKGEEFCDAATQFDTWKFILDRWQL